MSIHSGTYCPSSCSSFISSPFPWSAIIVLTAKPLLLSRMRITLPFMERCQPSPPSERSDRTTLASGNASINSLYYIHETNFLKIANAFDLIEHSPIEECAGKVYCRDISPVP